MTRDFSLSGTFQQKPFPILLVELKEAGTTGILLVRKDAIEKKIFFLNGEPVACRSNRKKELLGEILRARGKISRAQLDEAILETKKTTDHNFGEILLQKKFVTPDELYANTKYQFVSILFSLFAWEDGSYSFQEREASGLIPPGLPHFYVKFSKLISEGVRVIRDEGFVDRILGGNEQFVKRTAIAIPSKDLSFGGADQVILNALEDRMMVKDVAAAAGLEPGKVKRVLFTLSCLGAVELGAPGSLLDPDAVAAALTGGEEQGTPTDEGPPPSPVVTEEPEEEPADRSAQTWPLSEPEVAEGERDLGMEKATVPPVVEESMEEAKPAAPAADKIEAAVEQARTSLTGPAEGDAPLEEALAAAAAEDKGGVGDTPLAAEEVPAAQVPLEPEEEALSQEEESISPFARAMGGAGGAGAILQGSPGKGALEKGEVLPEGAVPETEEPEKADEPESVKAEAAKLQETREVKKKSSLAVPALAGLGAVLVGAGLIYFLKGQTPEPPAPPATTVQPPVADKSPAEIIRELAEEGGGEELAKATAVPDRPGGETGGADGSAKESAVTIQEETAPPAEKAASVDMAGHDGAKEEKLPGGIDEKASAPTPEALSPKAEEVAGARVVPEPAKREAVAKPVDSAEKLPSEAEAKKVIAASSHGEDGGAAEPRAEAKPAAAAPAKKEVAAKPAPAEAPAKAVKQTPTVQGTWEEHYARGLELFSNGSLEPAFKAWADTVRSAPDQAYAIQIELTSYLSYAARDIKEAAPDEKVFIVKATLKGKEYYKVLCGFYPDRAAAEQAFRVLTPYLKAQKPYLVRAIRLKPDLQD